MVPATLGVVTVISAGAVPPDTPPGRYTLRVVAYEVETGRPLPPAGGEVDLSLTLAEIALQPNPAAVDPGTLAIAQLLTTQFPGGLRLLGAESSAGPTNRPGDRLRVTLVWQATTLLPHELGLILALAEPDAAPIPLFKGPQPLITGYPTTEWPVGHVYRINYTIVLPARLATNEYALALRLVDLETSEPLAEQLLAPLDVEARAHIFDMPALAHQVNSDFGGVIRLLGYEPGAFTPGQPLTIKLQWQALQEVPDSYKLFVHLIDGGGRIVSQVDTLPQQGAAPTTGWVPGEIIEDEVTLTPPAEVSAGVYRVVVGLYDAQTGRRLIAGGQDQVVLVETEMR